MLGLGVAAVAMLVFSVLFLSGASAAVSMLVAALLSGVTATLASQPLTPATAMAGPAIPVVEPTLPASLAVEPPSTETLSAETLRRLRHDLRGILSPALMTADRLLMTTDDPVAKRAAETMVETVERAERRLAG